MKRQRSKTVLLLLIAMTGFFGCSKTQEKPIAGSQKEIMGEDSLPIVLIPAGTFLRGNNDGQYDERPEHTVYLDAFYMGKYEVTNAQYKIFIDATEHPTPEYWNHPQYNHPDQPVVHVSWYDANAYSEWADKCLPTEAEWEKAARGGLVRRRYPWGDEISYNDARYDRIGGKDSWFMTAFVGSFAPNGYGLYDMAGNVSEWCADWYNEDYYKSSPERNPKGPGSGKYRVVRGGAWDSNEDELRISNRSAPAPEYSSATIGFRCVWVIHHNDRE